MKCSLCNKEVEEFCSKNGSSVHEIKQKEIEKLKQQLKKQRVKYCQILQANFGSNSSDLNKQHLDFKTNSAYETVIEKQLQKIAKKQNTIAQIKSLKQKIEEKKTLLQLCKQRRNQKLKSLKLAQSNFQTMKTEIVHTSKEKVAEMNDKIKEKTKSLKNMNILLKKQLEETVSKDLATILAIYRVFRVRESEKLFHVKKVDELDFLNFDLMAQSFYEVQNIQEIAIKNKLSEKGVHIVLQNILILQIVQKICNFWVPYPIDCRIDLRSSRLIGKLENVRVCGRKLVDLGMTAKISDKIVQFFDESIRQSVSKQAPVKTEDSSIQSLEKPEFDEEIEYNKRIYAVSKEFINFMQMNMEFLSMKFGVQNRPFVFFQNNLMSQIQKEFLWNISFVEKDKYKPCPINFYPLGYNSMLKELKMTKLLDSLKSIDSSKLTQQSAELNQIIPEEVESEEQSQKQKVPEKIISKSETFIESYFSSFSKYFTFEQSANETESQVPGSLENVRSSSTENDQFQTLEPQ